MYKNIDLEIFENFITINSSIRNLFFSFLDEDFSKINKYPTTC